MSSRQSLVCRWTTLHSCSTRPHSFKYCTVELLDNGTAAANHSSSTLENNDVRVHTSIIVFASLYRMNYLNMYWVIRLSLHTIYSTLEHFIISLFRHGAVFFVTRVYLSVHRQTLLSQTLNVADRSYKTIYMNCNYFLNIMLLFYTDTVFIQINNELNSCFTFYIIENFMPIPSNLLR